LLPKVSATEIESAKGQESPLSPKVIFIPGPLLDQPKTLARIIGLMQQAPIGF